MRKKNIPRSIITGRQSEDFTGGNVIKIVQYFRFHSVPKDKEIFLFFSEMALILSRRFILSKYQINSFVSSIFSFP